MIIAGMRAHLSVAFFMGAVGSFEGRRRPLFGFLDRNDWARDAANNLALLRFEQDAAAQLAIAGEDTEEGRLIAFFNWVIEHKEEIIALIKMIMELFAGAPVPMVANVMSAGRQDQPSYFDLSGLSSRELADEVLRRLVLNNG